MGKLNVRFTDSLITHVQIAGKEFDSTVSNVARAALNTGKQPVFFYKINIKLK